MDWEYMVEMDTCQDSENFPGDMAESLEERGREGWELITALPLNCPDPFVRVCFIYKRPRN